MFTPGYSDMHGFAHSVADRPGGGSGPSQGLIEELALANRILFREGVVDAFGHVSVRSDADPQRYLLARNMAPALVTPEDIVEFDIDSHPLTANGRAVYLERFIHGEIYKARPDVVAVVHSHSPAVVPFGIVIEQALASMFAYTTSHAVHPEQLLPLHAAVVRAIASQSPEAARKAVTALLDDTDETLVATVEA